MTTSPAPPSLLLAPSARAGSVLNAIWPMVICHLLQTLPAVAAHPTTHCTPRVLASCLTIVLCSLQAH